MVPFCCSLALLPNKKIINRRDKQAPRNPPDDTVGDCVASRWLMLPFPQRLVPGILCCIDKCFVCYQQEVNDLSSFP